MADSCGLPPAGWSAIRPMPRTVFRKLSGSGQGGARETVRDWAAPLRHLATARALDLLRARCRGRNRTDLLADPAALESREAGPGQQAEADELADRLRVALAELPPQQAEVFCLSCVDNLTYGEIGERLRLTTNAVGVLLHRARQRLQELLVPVDARSTREH